MKVTVRCACVRVCRRVGNAVCEGVEHMERAIQGVGVCRGVKWSRRGCSACGGGRRGEGCMCVGGRGKGCMCVGGRGEGCMCVWGGKGEKGGEKEGGKFKVHICRCGILTMKITVLLPSHFW